MSQAENESATIRNFIIAGVLLTIGTLILFSLALFMGTFDTSTREAREVFERHQLERRLQTVGAVRVADDAADISLEAEDDLDAAEAAAEEAADVDTETDVAEEEVADVDTDAEVAEDEAEDVQRGEDVYASVCMACHAAGVMNALKLDDEEGWIALKEERGGLEELVHNAINGIGGMPARGGNSNLSDDEVRLAVVYMLEEAGLDVDGD